MGNAHPTSEREIGLKIAITGGAGSGKSVVAGMFQELGAAIMVADDRKVRCRSSLIFQKKPHLIDADDSFYYFKPRRTGHGPQGQHCH